MKGSPELKLPKEIAAPDYIASYLATNGWILSRADDSRMVWTLPERSDGKRPLSLMLPLDSTFADYDERFNEVVARLCALNSWDVEELASNIVQSRSDLFFVRADQATYNDSIPLKQAEQLISGSADLLLAAARSAITPKAHFHGKSPDLARDFMDRDVRMGHTRRGSFILTIVASLVDRHSGRAEAATHSPLPGDGAPSDNELELSDNERRSQERSVDEVRAEAFRAAEIASQSGSIDVANGSSSTKPGNGVPPFQRRVMTTLATGLQAARDISSSKSSAGSLDDAVKAGMSSNFLDSLDRMASFEGLRALDMRFKWSQMEPVRQSQPTEIIIPRAAFQSFRVTSDSLRERVDEDRYETIVGRVVRVEIDDEDHQSGEGVFRIKGMTGKSDRSANMLLSGDEYALAYRALRSRRLITATGHLEKIKGVWWMTGDVAIAEAPDGARG